jgi:hypothetical protein
LSLPFQKIYNTNASIDDIWALLPHGAAGFGYGAVNTSVLRRKEQGKKSGEGCGFYGIYAIPSREFLVQRENWGRKKEGLGVQKKSVISVFISY